MITAPPAGWMQINPGHQRSRSVYNVRHIYIYIYLIIQQNEWSINRTCVCLRTQIKMQYLAFGCFPPVCFFWPCTNNVYELLVLLLLLLQLHVHLNLIVIIYYHIIFPSNAILYFCYFYHWTIYTGECVLYANKCAPINLKIICQRWGWLVRLCSKPSTWLWIQIAGLILLLLFIYFFRYWSDDVIAQICEPWCAYEKKAVWHLLNDFLENCEEEANTPVHLNYDQEQYIISLALTHLLLYVSWGRLNKFNLLLGSECSLAIYTRTSQQQNTHSVM